MIRHKLNLKKEYRDRNFYIWDPGISAVEVFTALSERLIRVKGFVTENKSDMKESFMNCPVISGKKFSRDRKGVLVLPDSAVDYYLDLASGYGKAVRISELFEADEEIFSRKPVLYGTGNGAWKYLKKMTAGGAEISGFIRDGKNADTESIMGFPVYDSEIPDRNRDIVICASNEYRKDEMLLKALSLTDADVFADEIFVSTSRWGAEPFQMIDRALKDGKKIFLLSDSPALSELIRNILQMYSAVIDREVCCDESSGMDDIWALAEENADESVLLISALDSSVRADAVDAANDLGYSEEKRNYACVQTGYASRERMTGTLSYEYDDRTGQSIDYSVLGGLPGWYVYGNRKNHDVSLMVLGGSTSSDIFHAESWVSFLYERLKREGMNPVIYNGAHEGNCAADELERLSRSVDWLRPDIVISFSGLNDYEPSRNKFGHFSMERIFDLWKNTEKKMKAVAELSGADFHVFLQPINLCIQDCSFSERLQFTYNMHSAQNGFMKLSLEDDFAINLIDLFHHSDEMFVDSCHYTEKANEIIAEIIHDTIRRSL